MTNKLQHFIKSLQSKYPFRSIYLRRAFKLEYRLIKGELEPQSKDRSFIHMSMNKCATQFVRSVIFDLVDKSGLVKLNLNSLAFQTDFPYLNLLGEKEFEEYKKLFLPTGCCYSVFGGPLLHLGNSDEFRKYIMIRDPRDVLVSEYYSFKYSHPTPIRSSGKYSEFMQSQALAKSLSIDEFVLRRIAHMDKLLGEYLSVREVYSKNTSIWKYEDFIKDKWQWFLELARLLQVELSQAEIKTFQEKVLGRTVKKENLRSHFRKGVSGDYKSKLETVTIDTLTTSFSGFLEAFDYHS
jgi:hypothetical protein